MMVWVCDVDVVYNVVWCRCMCDGMDEGVGGGGGEGSGKVE